MLMSKTFFFILYMCFVHNIDKYLNRRVCAPTNFDEVLKSILKSMDRVKFRFLQIHRNPHINIKVG
jgi:hypothetical protein